MILTFRFVCDIIDSVQYNYKDEWRVKNTMSTIISVDFTSRLNCQNQCFQEVSSVQTSRVPSAQDLIQPAEEEVCVELANEHTSEPIKNIEDIDQISKYLIDNQRYRDNMLFVLGINFGLRVSDLRMLRFCQLINNDLTFKSVFPILEKKTKDTRKVKRNRYITVNDAVIEAVTLYLEHNQCKLDDYMFRSESNHGSNRNKPLSRMSIDRILKEIADTLDLDIKMATHTLRKTFAYHQMLMSNNDPRKLLLLQKMFGHSSATQTLDYIGITGEEIEEAYLGLNLGSHKHYLVDSVIQETALMPVS